MPTPLLKRPDAARAPRSSQPKTLDAIHPNAGLRVAYQRKLESLVDDLHASVVYWLRSAYRANAPEMAMDASPAAELSATMRGLARRWQRNFNRGAPEMAAWFAKNSAERTDASMKAALQRAGFSVKFKLTPAANDIIQATTFDNVSLIRSIASEYLTDVEGIVMRSVSQGRDLKTISDELQSRFALTRNRAVLIARDQSNKSTAAINRARQDEIGITEAIWLHTGASKHPRASHVAFSGQKYNIREGALIDKKRIWPGTEIWCHCICKSIIPGFE